MGAEGFEPPPADFFWNHLSRWGYGLQDCNRSALQLVINCQQTHSSSFLCNWSPRYYQAILYSHDWTPHQALACRRARLRRRSFLRRHFHRWFPVFFQAREPRFIVYKSPTDHSYMSASGYTALNSLQLFQNFSLNQHNISIFNWKRAYQDSNPSFRLRRPKWYPSYTIRPYPQAVANYWWMLHMNK